MIDGRFDQQFAEFFIGYDQAMLQPPQSDSRAPLWAAVVFAAFALASVLLALIWITPQRGG